jgi:diguanylate cyclase (GGDEF)-like protein
MGLDDIPRKADLLKRLQKSLDADELVAALFLDLGGFKQVNDQLGHGEGDNCLKRVVEVIGGAVQGKGQLFRPGGDEFVVTFPISQDMRPQPQENAFGPPSKGSAQVES